MERYDYTKLTVEEMLKKLARYPMEERLGSMFNHSLTFINNNYDVVKTNNINEVQPWEMETFILLCIMANNNFTPNSFKSKQGNREKQTILSNIRLEMEFWEEFNNEELSEVLIPAIANLEFPIQHFNFFYSTYRYNYLFNIDEKLKLEFYNKYHLEYEDIVTFFFVLDIILRNSEYKSTTFNYLFKSYFKICNIFVKNLEDIIEAQKIIAPNPKRYKYAFKLFTSYPFIFYDNCCYLSLPHNLITACTDSLLIRLTSEEKPNDELRKAFGTPFEKYVFKILNDSEIYKYIIPETIYTNKGKKIKSSDVIFSDNTNIVFVDAKLSQTSVMVKNVDIEYIRKTTKQYAEGIIQLHKRMNEYPHIFNPFEFTCNKDNIFGLLVVLEDSNLLRHNIYQEVFNTLNIDKESETAIYIKSHISICGINELEKLTFTGKSILPHLKQRKESDSHFGYPIICSDIEEKQTTKHSIEIKKYKNKIVNNIKPYIENLIKNEYIKLKTPKA